MSLKIVPGSSFLSSVSDSPTPVLIERRTVPGFHKTPEHQNQGDVTQEENHLLTVSVSLPVLGDTFMSFYSFCSQRQVLWHAMQHVYV